MSPTAAGRFTRREPQPTRKVTPAAKRVDMPDGPDERRRGDDAYARDLMKPSGDRMLADHAGELLIDRGEARFEVAHLLQDDADRVTHEIGQRYRRVFQQGGNAGQRGPRAHA